METIPEKRMPTHPVHVLIDEFLKPRGISPGSLGAGNRITPELAAFLGSWLGVSPLVWLRGQAEFDQWAEKHQLTPYEAAEQADYDHHISSILALDGAGQDR